MPRTIWLFRITHIANLEHDLLKGLCVANSANANPNYLQIGDSSLIKRGRRFAKIGLGCHLFNQLEK